MAAVTGRFWDWLSATYKVKFESRGFQTSAYNIRYGSSRPSLYQGVLSLGAAAETVEVTAEAGTLETESAEVSSSPLNGRNFSRLTPLAPGAVSQPASASVVNLQKRLAGVLPVPIDVSQGRHLVQLRPAACAR